MSRGFGRTTDGEARRSRSH